MSKKRRKADKGGTSGQRVSEADRALFLDAIGDVEPVAADHLPPEPARPAPRRRQQPGFDDLIESAFGSLDPLSDGFAQEAQIEQGESISYIRPGAQKALLRKLRRGQFSRSASLDLHGMTIDEARVAISRFIASQRHDARCCIRIVHGKGYRSAQQRPVLKNMLNHWLPQRDDVIAFCSAPVHDGGTGAVYVLLKKA